MSDSTQVSISDSGQETFSSGQLNGNGIPKETPKKTSKLKEASKLLKRIALREPGVPVEPQRQFKLISVSFKEAALDSPSFRASVNHLDLQLMNTEKWVIAMAALLVKIPRHVKELLSFFNSFLEYLVPLFLQDGLLDQEYTELSLHVTLDGLKTIWTLGLGLLSFNMAGMEAVKDAIVERISEYKAVRSRFHESQKKYDRFLLLHMATAKSKEAALVMEDLAQLFSVRREYVQTSLDLVVELSSVGDMINHRLLRLSYDIWEEKIDRFGDNPMISVLLEGVWTKIKRLQAWCDQYQKAVFRLGADMNAAKHQVEESSVAQFMPSMHVEDYRSLLINARLLAETDEQSAEKHGYLFMKTWVDKSAKPVWVKRWAFIQGGVFGLLVLSPSHTSVQESDKIGVLLCSSKYDANEDRRFCFEVKTIDSTVVFQAETLAELKSWLKVFENCRNRILDLNDPMSGLIAIASGRYPPLVTELLSSVNTVTDRLLTNPRIINSEGQIITSSKLSTHLEKNEKLFQRYIYYQATRIKLPMMTDTTRSSLIAYSLVGSTAVPTALSANIWGSLNWGHYYLQDADPVDTEVGGVPEEEFTRQIGLGIKVPKNYPNSWLASDIQMRALFESAVDPLECCLVSFTCLWSPNARQELRGTTFVTQKHIYDYPHSTGFVALNKARIETVVDVTCTRKKNHDLLKMTLVGGLSRIKLFLDDGQLIADKLNYIIKNIASDKPVGVSAMISQLVEMETAHHNEKMKVHYPLVEEPQTNASSFDFAILHIPADAVMKVDHSDEMLFLGEQVFKLPPKALFHVLFGFQSAVVADLYPVVSVTHRTTKEWMRVPGHDRALFREFVSTLLYHNGKSGRVVVKQELDEIVENQYYSCKLTRSSFRVMFCTEFDSVTRFVIVGIEGGQSKLMYYATANFKNKWIFNFVLDNLHRTFCISFFRKMCRQVDGAAKQIGHSGKILKAIYLYGKIPVTETPYPAPEIPPTNLNYLIVLRLLFRGTITMAVRRAWAFLYFVVSAIKTLLGSLSMNMSLVFIILIMGLINLLLVKRSTDSYWNAREARGMVSDIVQFEPMKMQRSIYLKDVQDLILKEFSGRDSVCFKTFKNQSFVMNYDQSSSWKSAYEDDLTRETAVRLRKTLQDIGIRRNELLVSLRMLNQMEEDIAREEWRIWLISELGKCDYVQHRPITPNDVNASGFDFASGVEMLLEYCDSCSQEMKMINL